MAKTVTITIPTGYEDIHPWKTDFEQQVKDRIAAKITQDAQNAAAIKTKITSDTGAVSATET